MTVKELVLLSLENFDAFQIDMDTSTKQVTESLYLSIADFEIESYYLSINKETNQPQVIIKLKNY